MRRRWGLVFVGASVTVLGCASSASVKPFTPIADASTVAQVPHEKPAFGAPARHEDPLPTFVRVELLGARIGPTKADGDAWDCCSDVPVGDWIGLALATFTPSVPAPTRELARELERVIPREVISDNYSGRSTTTTLAG